MCARGQQLCALSSAPLIVIDSAMSTSRSPFGPGAGAPCQPSSSVESSGYLEPDPDSGLLLPVTRSSLLTRRLLRLRARGSSPVARRTREMIPTEQKDSAYWDKRLKNNEAAKRSRDKRRLSDLELEGQLLALSDENKQLRAQVLNLCAERSDAFATSTAPGSTLPRSPRPVHSPAALFQTPLWGSGSPASVLGARQRESAIHPFEAKIPRGVGGFPPHGYHTCGAQRGGSLLRGPRSLSPRAALEAGRLAETDAQRQVSSSDDVRSSSEAIPHTPDALRHAALLSHRSWPSRSAALMCNNFLLPWRPFYLAPAAVYPDLPLYMRERHGLGLGVRADTQGGFKSPAPAGPSPLGMHLSPDGH
ncbi:uncharacterized protein si:dkey-172o19.2 [Cyclopterus lumpus]|uniref:uncharacterized protein si:dkey-172o19.2 n=1 Tax=Cyclopterus lumpus TaxID=8103 RepID=UPI00148684AA|nr:uncharacterized protein si:dkey-172o19.2 [Cyclopterus lumpus]